MKYEMNIGEMTSVFTFVDFQLFEYHGNLSCSDPYLLFISNFHQKFRKSCLATRVYSEPLKKEYYQWPKDLNIYPLRHKNTFYLFSLGIFKFPRFSRLLKEAAKPFSHLLLCWPHPISYILLKEFAGKKKIFLLVRQNQLAITKAKYQGIKKAYATLGLKILDKGLEKAKNHVEIITVGEEMNQFYRLNNFSSRVLSDSIISESIKGSPKCISHQSFRLLYVGRIEKEKGLDILLKACAILKHQGLKFQLNVVGEGSDMDQLRQYCVKEELQNEVIFKGHIKHGEQLYYFYQNSDLLIIPSRTEGFPKVIHEARAFGLPIVSTQIGGIQKEMKHKTNIYFCDEVNEESLARALVEILSDNKIYRQISNNLLKEFEMHTMEMALSRYYNLFIK